jgi:HEAT repeat protein
MLADSNPGVRNAAARALSDIGEPAVQPLIRALWHDEMLVRGSAAVILGRIGDSRAVPKLIDTLADPEATVRQSAARALGCIGDVRAKSALLSRAHDDRDKHVREAARESIEKL